MKRRIAASTLVPVAVDIGNASEYKNQQDHYPRKLQPRRDLMVAWDQFNTERGFPTTIDFPPYIPVAFLEYYAPNYVGVIGPQGPAGPEGPEGPAVIQVFAQQNRPTEGSTPWLWVELNNLGQVIGEEVYVP